MAVARSKTTNQLISDTRYAVPLQVGSVVGEAFAAMGYSVCLLRESHLVKNVANDDDLIWSAGIRSCLTPSVACNWDDDLRLAAYLAASNGQSVDSGVSRPRSWPFGNNNTCPELRGRIASAWLQHGGWVMGFVWIFSTKTLLRQVDRDQIRNLVHQAVPEINAWASTFDGATPSTMNRYRDQRRGLLSLSPTEQQIYDHLKTGATEREIADAMHRSPNTIHTHVKTIYRKKRVTSRADLLANFMSEAITDLAPGRDGVISNSSSRFGNAV